MAEQLVVSELESIIAEKQGKSRGRWYGAFDVMAWLNVLAEFSHELQLELRYEDDKGPNQIMIDRAGFSSNPLMLLSNRLSVAFVGAVTQASLWVTSEGEFKTGVLEARLSPARVSAHQYLNAERAA